MKDTNNLQQELMTAPDLDRFLSENQYNFLSGNILDLLNTLFRKRNISKAALAKQSGMSEVYLHQVFAGRRNPSRSRKSRADTAFSDRENVRARSCTLSPNQ